MALKRESAKERAAREADAAAAREAFRAELVACVAEHAEAKKKKAAFMGEMKARLMVGEFELLNEVNARELLRRFENSLTVEVMLRMRIAGMVSCLPADEVAGLIG